MLMMKPLLIQLCGLPGSGKSTLSNVLSTELHIPVLSHDVISAALSMHKFYNFDEPFSLRRKPTRSILNQLAKLQLYNKISVIVDSLAEDDGVRNEARALCKSTNSRYVLIHCVCSDQKKLERRLDSRNRNIEAWGERGADHLTRVSPHFMVPADPAITVDTVEPIERCVAAIKACLW